MDAQPVSSLPMWPTRELHFAMCRLFDSLKKYIQNVKKSLALKSAVCLKKHTYQLKHPGLCHIDERAHMPQHIPDR